MKPETLSISSPGSSRLGRLPGGIAASISILWPKCPVCWMMLTGWAIGRRAVTLDVEVAGIALFSYSFYTLLRSKRVTLGLVLLLCAASASMVFAGIWVAHSLSQRILTCALLIATSFMPATWMQRRPTVDGAIPCSGACHSCSLRAIAEPGAPVVAA